MRQMDAEIEEKEKEFEQELSKDWDEEEDDEGGRAHLQKQLDAKLMKINTMASDFLKKVHGLEKF